MRGDAAAPDLASRVLRAAVERFGRIDGVFHVAGGSGRRFGDGPLDQITDEGWQQTLALTADGRKLVPSLSALADRNDAEFFGHLKPSERTVLEKMLRDIVRRHDLKTIPTE